MPHLNEQHEIESEGTEFIDFKLIAHYPGFVLKSVRRHVKLVLAVSGGIFVTVMIALSVMPKTYHVETKILAQRNHALSVPGDNGNDSPTQGATESVMRRDNLIALIRQTDLLNQWYNHRAPILRLKDFIYSHIRAPDTPQEMTDWMVDVLEKKLTVWTTDGVVGIGVDWPDPTVGLHLVEAAQQNFLEARHVEEVTALAEEVAILRGHADSLRSDIDSSVDAIEKLRAKPIEPKAAASAAAPESSATAPKAAAVAAEARPHSALPDPEIARLKALIEAKQRAIDDLEESRRRRLSDLNASLAEKRAMYTDNHPVIVDLVQTIASLSSESPQVRDLREEVAKLQSQLEERTALAAGSDVPSARSALGAVLPGLTTPPPLPGSIIRIEQETNDEKDPAMAYARGQLGDAMNKYSSLRSQIEAAQIEFDTAEAAFKYRYSVIEPPLFPKHPSKPSAALFFLAGLVGGFVVAIFAALAKDILAGRFVESWQVESALALPVLVDIDVATLPKHSSVE